MSIYVLYKLKLGGFSVDFIFVMFFNVHALIIGLHMHLYIPILEAENDLDV